MVQYKNLSDVAIDQDFLDRVHSPMGHSALFKDQEAIVPRPPLVLQGAGGDVPDELHWVGQDGTILEYAVVDKARFERLRHIVDVATEDTWEGQEGRPFPPFAEAMAALQPGDLDPLP